MKKCLIIFMVGFGILALTPNLDASQVNRYPSRYNQYSTHYGHRQYNRYARRIWKRIRKNENRIMKYRGKIYRLQRRYNYYAVGFYKHHRIRAKIYRYRQSIRRLTRENLELRKRLR